MGGGSPIGGTEMPWTVNDVDKHNKGLSPKQKKQWVSTANSALSRCEAGKVKPQGGESCDAYAIKVANSAVSRSSSRVGTSVPIRAVKGQDNRYRAYAVLFNGPDTRDLYGTWFNQDTDYAMGMYSDWPWMYHHGKHPDYGTRKVGVWDTRGIDDVGVFVEGEITTHGMYREAVEQLVDEEVLFTSSQAVHSMVAIADDGHVDVWPICEVSSTVAPGDHRMEHPISPSAVRALEILNQEETTMTWKDKLRGLIDDLPADLFRSKDAGGEDGDGDDKDKEDDTEAVTESKTESGTEQTGVDADELVRAVVEALDLGKFVRAITKLDEHVRSISKRVAQVEMLVAGLSRGETERIKSALTGDDWFKDLYVASRSAEDDPDAGDDDGDVAPTQSLSDDETVFGRLVAGAPQ